MLFWTTPSTLLYSNPQMVKDDDLVSVPDTVSCVE
jgi:hypothetical protein